MHARRPQALAVAFLATAFALGGATGWGLKGWSIAKRRPVTRDPQAMVAYLSKQLGLAPAQGDSVQAVLDRHRTAMDSIWHATRPHLDSLRRVIQVEIEEQLTASQQRRFQGLLARHERRRQAADSASDELWDPDHDGVSHWIDKCQDTPEGAQVDAEGCTVH